jgi:hypothetical protein
MVGYSRGPALDPYAAYGYAPMFAPTAGSPYGNSLWDPGYAFNLGYARDKGEVKLTDVPENAKIYLDNSYAGTAHHLKRIWLEPGAYDLAIAVPDRETLQQRIYVLGGKTLKIAANQAPTMPESPTEKEKP